MHIIEPHIHMYSRTTDDYQAMYEAGIRVCVEPAFWLGSPRTHPSTFFDYFQHILEFESQRAARFGIDHYAAISMNPKEADDAELAARVIDGMDTYLDHPRCVAVGEIGLNENTQNEIEAFRRQLLIAEERGMPIVVHLPHGPKTEGAKIILEIIRAEGATQERILLDHNDEESIEVSIRSDCYCGMTVYPYSKLNPGRVSAMIRTHGAERMMVAGSADWGVSDPLALVRVVEYLREDGHEESVIRTLVHDNPNDFYSHSPHWTPNPHLEPVPISEFQR
jgi:hypothetical protein